VCGSADRDNIALNREWLFFVSAEAEGGLEEL
jgi:hypothetical protein